MSTFDKYPASAGTHLGGGDWGVPSKTLADMKMMPAAMYAQSQPEIFLSVVDKALGHMTNFSGMVLGGVQFNQNYGYHASKYGVGDYKYLDYEIMPAPTTLFDIEISNLKAANSYTGVGKAFKLAGSGHTSVQELLAQQVVDNLPQIFHANPDLAKDVKEAVIKALKV